MDLIDDQALWLSDRLLRSSGDSGDRALVREIRQEMENGVPFEKAKGEASGRQPNDFGLEIVGPVLTFVILEALKSFWSGYLKKLTDGPASKAADMTAALIRDHFLRELESPAGAAVRAEIEARIASEATDQGLEPEKIAGI